MCIGRSTGSIAAFNTMLLIIPATRNSVLTLLLGLPFDQVLCYHRFLGRFAILCGLVHMSYYAYYWKDKYHTDRYIYFTGFLAMAFGVVIFFTSLDYFRRNYFNTFFWSHYSFIGYLTMAYIHSQTARPYVIVGIILYLADKLLRFLWTLLPSNMILFKCKEDSIAQV